LAAIALSKENVADKSLLYQQSIPFAALYCARSSWSYLMLSGRQHEHVFATGLASHRKQVVWQDVGSHMLVSGPAHAQHVLHFDDFVSHDGL
jgi:hypothetical protein